MPQIVKAFIGRSFLDEDEKRLKPTLDFLDTFKNAGFICQTAEPAEVQSVSAKVRRLIDDSDVFIGFFTRRYPIYNLKQDFLGGLRVGRGSVPRLWSAPAWVLQESGYALQKMGIKRLILLREPDVEVFGLQGDLEYIPFVPEKAADVFSKLSEMIHGLLADATGTQIEMIVTQRQEEALAAPEPTLPTPKSEASANEAEQPDIIAHFIEMSTAADNRDLDAVRDAWRTGASLIEQGQVKDKSLDQLTWDCYYHEESFNAGDPEAIERMRKARADNPGRREPTASLANCLYRSKEYEEAAQLYLKAADLSGEDTKAWYLVRAGEAFQEQQDYVMGKRAVETALAIATGDLKVKAISLLYQLMKDGGELHLAFATAEWALHENPQLRLRFKLGLDYHRNEMYELAMHHFKFLCDRNSKDSSALHNLALMYSDCKLPINAVQRYKSAFAMGETLSAANLGHMYLDSGMSDEATRLLDEAVKMEGHEPRVEKCIAEILQRTEDEKSKEVEILATARGTRDLFIEIGRALRIDPPSVSGVWRFPFGEMSLFVIGGEVAGAAEIKTEQPGFGFLLSNPGDPPRIKTEKYSLTGKLTGAVCSFSLNITEALAPNMIAINSLYGLLGSAGVNRSGFIVFASATSAKYFEMDGRKPGKIETISKIR